MTDRTNIMEHYDWRAAGDFFVIVAQLINKHSSDIERF